MIAANPASPMWIAMPEGTSWLSPGLRVSGASRQARRSSPAAPGVPYCGSIARILASRILTSSRRKLALRFRRFARELRCNVRDELARQIDLGAAPKRVPAARIEQRDCVVVGAERFLHEVRGDQRHALLQALFRGVRRDLLALGG